MNLLYLALLLCAAFCFGQDAASFELTKESDTLFWYKYKNQTVAEYALDTIETSRADYALRISWRGSSVAIYKNMDKAWGWITLMTYEVNNKDSIVNKSFWMQFNLKQEEADEILAMADSINLQNIPSYKKIKGWSKGVDGITYLIETKNAGLYSFKTYWSPEIQNVPEANTILLLINKLKQICTDKKLYEKFDLQIPFKIFSKGNMFIATRIFSKKTERKFDERQNYIRGRQAIIRQSQPKN